MLAGLWPWGKAGGGESIRRRRAQHWRDVLEEAFRNVSDDGWMYTVVRKRPEFDSEEWCLLHQVFNRADGQQVWLYSIAAHPCDGGYWVEYGFGRPPHVTFADVERMYGVEYAKS